jgi:anaerobic selenocysteine-containing dehydrogenase
MSGESKSTTDHGTIRRWAEERDGKPVRIKGGGIELDFPGYSGGDRFEEISWDEWFEAFDEKGLELTYQETTKDGEQSNFNKLTSRS